MKNPLLAPLALALLAACGCSRQVIIDRIAPDDIQQASRKAYTDLKAGRFEQVRERLRDELKGRDLDGEFRRMAAAIPDGPEPDVTAVDFHAYAGTGGTRYDITYRYDYPGQWVQARFGWSRDNGDLRLTGIAVNAFDSTANDADTFTLEGKGPFHYLVLLLAASVFTVSFVALFKCVFRRGLRRKWAWALFIVLGFGAFAFNWTTGAWRLSLLNVQLMSVAALRPFAGPWTITIAVPVGALVFLYKLRRLGRAEREQAGRVASPPP